MDNEPMKIDVDQVLRERLPKHYKFIPRFAVRWLERVICQDRLNVILEKMAGKDGVDAAAAALDEMNITIDAKGLDRLVEGRYMFVSNHPLGGLDGLGLISLLGNRYDHHIKFMVNDLLMAVKPLHDVFLPVNKYGKQSREAAVDIEQALAGDDQFITFPAGLCSRMQPGGAIADLTWQKSFVLQAVNHKRDIVPVYFDARNSQSFYRFAKWRERLGIKFNIELIFLPKEMIKQSGTTLHVFFGDPIPWSTLDTRAPKRQAAGLRDIVYSLANHPDKP